MWVRGVSDGDGEGLTEDQEGSYNQEFQVVQDNQHNKCFRARAKTIRSCSKNPGYNKKCVFCVTEEKFQQW